MFHHRRSQSASSVNTRAGTTFTAATAEPARRRCRLRRHRTTIDDAAAAQKARDTIETTLAQLRPTKAGTDERKHLVEALHEALTDVSGRTGKQQRALVRAFVDSDGPEIVYEMESSMTGNWMIDAKNGTMKRLSSIGRLPGPIGQAVCAYRRVAEKISLMRRTAWDAGYRTIRVRVNRRFELKSTDLLALTSHTYDPTNAHSHARWPTSRVTAQTRNASSQSDHLHHFDPC